MKIHSTYLSLILLAAIFAPLVFAQQQQQPPLQKQPQSGTAAPRTNSESTTPATAATGQDDQGRIIVTTREVSLPISVVDKKGVPISGLTQSDFAVLEDKQPQAIKSFAIESNNLPVYVAVLMDTSASTAGKLDFEKEAALNFIYNIARPRKDRVAFATFDDEVIMHQDFTEKLDLVDKAIRKVKKPGVQTSLYNAVWQFCNEKMRGVSGLRALVIISDGDDSVGQATLEEAIEIAQSTETMIFGISTKAGFSGVVAGVEMGQVKDRGDRNLEKLCEETGGRAFFTGDKLALERAFGRVAKELRSQYIVSYRPSNENYDGRFRRIEVKLARQRDDMKVRTRRGYRALRRTTDGQ